MLNTELTSVLQACFEASHGLGFRVEVCMRRWSLIGGSPRFWSVLASGGVGLKMGDLVSRGFGVTVDDLNPAFP